MNNNNFEEETINFINNEIGKIQDIMHSRTFMCSIYYLKYLENHDAGTLNKFMSLFEKLDYYEMLQVFANINAKLKEQEKIKIKSKINAKEVNE